MKHTLTIGLFGLLCLAMTACNDYKGFKKTESGLYYRFHTQNANGNVPQSGDVVTLFIEVRTDNDSVIQSGREIQTMMQPAKFEGDIYEGLQLMHLGDSATFIIPAKAYFETYNYGNVPAFVKKKSMLRITACIHNIQTFEEYKAQQVQEVLAKEKELIQNYLESKNLQVEPTESGLYYIETRAGKGKHPEKGMDCTVHYRGTLFDGTVFDASYDRNKPFTFTLGKGQVIAGWDEGIALMKKGGKATLLLPSAIAYGERGAGEHIPPFTPLVFEVELIDFH